jgi:hypothetical protein
MKFVAETMSYDESVRLEELLEIFKVKREWAVGGCGNKPHHCEFEINLENEK